MAMSHAVPTDELPIPDHWNSSTTIAEQAELVGPFGQNKYARQRFTAGPLPVHDCVAQPREIN
jgi:hypothetical protein